MGNEREILNAIRQKCENVLAPGSARYSALEACIRQISRDCEKGVSESNEPIARRPARVINGRGDVFLVDATTRETVDIESRSIYGEVREPVTDCNRSKMREALERFSAVDLSRLKFPLDGDSSAIYNSDKKEITIPYWMVAELLNEVKVAQDMAKAALASPPRNCDALSNADNVKAMYDALLKVKRLFDGRIMFQQAIREAHEAVNAALASPPEPIGNMAKQREVLQTVLNKLACLAPRIIYIRGDKKGTPPWVLELGLIVESALSSPPRNCDRFVDELDAQIEFLNDVWLISVTKDTMLERDKFENWTEEMKTSYAKWLLEVSEKVENNGK